jgi:hypothetical protein
MLNYIYKLKIKKLKTLKNLRAGKILTSVAIIFMLSWVTLLSSCVATVRTPRHARSNVVIETQVQGHGERNARTERRERRQHRDND